MNSNQIMPAGNKYIILDKTEDQSIGSIILPKHSRTFKGEVFAAGINVGKHQRAAKVGDIVLYSDHKRAEVTIKGIDYLVIDATDVFCII